MTATAEVAGNAWRHAGGGHVRLDRVEDAARVGITVTAMDRGPGIADVEAAMRDGWSTAASMGFGLPGARRLMDDFEVLDRTGGGTVVTMTRWRRKARTLGCRSSTGPPRRSRRRPAGGRWSGASPAAS